MIKKLLLLAAISICLVACNSGGIAESSFPKEFYVLNQNCFGRYFYENAITGQHEFELYCNGKEKMELTESEDSICLDNGIEIQCFSKIDFYSGYGKPIAVNKVPSNEIVFSIDTLLSESDSSMLGEQNQLQKIKISIAKGGLNLFERVYKCNRLVQFDSNNISVYNPITHPDVYIVDGIESCLIMEMAYYDQVGEFAGWERLSADIRAITNPQQQ